MTFFVPDISHLTFFCTFLWGIFYTCSPCTNNCQQIMNKWCHDHSSNKRRWKWLQRSRCVYTACLTSSVYVRWKTLIRRNLLRLSRRLISACLFLYLLDRKCLIYEQVLFLWSNLHVLIMSRLVRCYSRYTLLRRISVFPIREDINILRKELTKMRTMTRTVHGES